MLLPLLPGVVGAAVYRGADDEHRLSLTRLWDEPDGRYALWIGMNPSGATETRDDLTVRKEQVWTRRMGLTRYIKCNVGTYRWTNSRTLADAGVPLVHPENVQTILNLAAEATCIVLTTGAPPDPLIAPARAIFAGLAGRGRVPLCLGRTRQGWPKHSSRLGYATPLEPFLGVPS